MSFKKFVRIHTSFQNRSSLMKSAFYALHGASKMRSRGSASFFGKTRDSICVICNHAAQQRKAILLTAEMNLLQQLYRSSDAFIGSGRSSARHSLRMDLEDFLSRLQCRQFSCDDLKPIYKRAARDFWWHCGKKDPREAQTDETRLTIPSEILDRCPLLQTQWAHDETPNAFGASNRLQRERVRHPRSPIYERLNPFNRHFHSNERCAAAYAANPVSNG